MKRITTIVGLIAALTLTAAVTAAPASAVGFMADQYPAALSGSGSNHTFNTNVSLNCSSSSLEVPPTDRARKDLTAAVAYSGCTFGKQSLSVNTNGCKLTLNANGDVTPSNCGSIKFTGQGCEQVISLQGSPTGVTYQNSGSSVIASINVGTKWSASGWACGNGSGSGSYTGSWTIAGSGGNGFHVANPVGFLFAGGEFDAEAHPYAVLGSQSTQHALVTNAGTLKCTTVEYGMPGATSQSVTGFPLLAQYGGCTLFTMVGNISVNVNMNGCGYRYEAAGTVSLMCPEGSAMVASGPGCTLTVPAQQIATVQYVHNYTVKATESGSGIQYSANGFTCGSHSGANGTYSGSTTLRAIS